MAARLARECDVVLENFRPGTLERWGLGYEALSASNPKLVLVHISGFGQTGPLAGQAGFGSVGEAMGGIRHTTGSPDRPPSRAGISLEDCVGSLRDLVMLDTGLRSYDGVVAAYDTTTREMVTVTVSEGRVTRRTVRKAPERADSNVIELAARRRAV